MLRYLVICLLLCTVIVQAEVYPAEKLTLDPASKTVLADEAGGKVLVTDISAPHAGNWYAGTLLASYNQWVTLPPGRYRVRYRAAVDHVGAANVSLWGEVLAAIPAHPERGHFRAAWGRWLGVDVLKADAWQDLDVTLDLPETTMVQPQFLWRRTTKEPGDITRIKLASIEVTPVATPLVVSQVRASKVHYLEDELGEVAVTVLNGTEAPQQGRVRLRLFADLDTKGILVNEGALTLPARSVQHVTVPLPKLGKYGYEVRAEVLDAKGTVLDSRSDYFTVHNNVLEVGHAGDYPFRGDTYSPYPFGFRGSDAELADFTRRVNVWADAAQSVYTNTVELFAWGPADCIKLVPPTEDWKCGQTKYPLSVSRTKAYIAACHRVGIKVQLYNQSLWGIDDDGSYLQEHPEYFAYNAEGRPQGFNLHQPEPVDDHIKGLLASIKVFDWDGVRWDGHFDYCPPYDDLKTLFGEKIDVSKRDAQVAAINDKIRAAVRPVNPRFTWGHNWNDQVENFTNSQEMRSICANGAWIMNEAIKDSEAPTSGTHKWTDYAARVASGNRLVRAKGGLYLLVPPPQYFQSGSQHLYKAILAYAGHAYLYGTTRADCTPNVFALNAFLTRYARILRSREFSDVPDAEKVAAVQSPRPLWWKSYLTQKTSPGQVEQVLSLVNPPVATAVTNAPDGALPPVQENVTVTLKAPAGMTRAEAVWLAFDRAPFQQILPVTIKNGAAQVTVPEVRYWSVLDVKWSK
jgi:hypothetical protein